MTEVVRTRAELRDAPRRGRRARSGLVPTMGWLHDGHRALIAAGPRRQRDDGRDDLRQPAPVQRGRRLHAVPAQRGTRPRDRARPRASTSSSRPTVDEVYPPGFDTAVSVGAVAQPLEGAARPGHFDGVATVVAILFDLVGAERAYFGQKDAQQVMVIRQMARDLAIADRGHRLPDGPRAGRPRAVVAQRPPHAGAARRGAGPPPGAARGARARWEAGERSARRAPRRDARRARPRAAGRRRIRLGRRRLDPRRARHGATGPALLSLAVRFGTTRLIDNEPLG